MPIFAIQIPADQGAGHLLARFQAPADKYPAAIKNLLGIEDDSIKAKWVGAIGRIGAVRVSILIEYPPAPGANPPLPIFKQARLWCAPHKIPDSLIQLRGKPYRGGTIADAYLAGAPPLNASASP